MTDQRTYIIKAIRNNLASTEELSGRIRGAAARAKAILAEKALSHHDEVKVYCLNSKRRDYVGKAMFCGIGTTGQRIEWVTKGSGITGVGGGSVRAIGINRSARLGITYK